VTILDDDADAGVVEEDVDRDEQRAEDQIETDADCEGCALDGEVSREPRVQLIEEPHVHVGEEDPVDDPGDESQSEKSPEVRAAGREESVRARRPLTGVAIEHAAAQEGPEDQPRSSRARDRRRHRQVVEDRAEILEHRAEADDRRNEGRAQT
jgi:hypothetical protein